MAQETPDKGVENPAPAPGMMGMLRSTLGSTFGQVKGMVVGSPRASTPTSGAESAQQESDKAADLKDGSPPGVDESGTHTQVGDAPQELSPDLKDGSPPSVDESGTDTQVGEVPQELSPDLKDGSAPTIDESGTDTQVEEVPRELSPDLKDGSPPSVDESGADTQVEEVPQELSPDLKDGSPPSVDESSTDTRVEEVPQELSTDLKDSTPPIVDESRTDTQFEEVPQELSPPDQQLEDPVWKDSQAEELPQELSEPDQQAGQEETAVTGVRDFGEDRGVDTSPETLPTGSSGPVEAGASPVASSLQDGTAASPQIPQEDLREQIPDGTNSNSVESPTPQTANPQTEDDPSAVPSSPSVQPSEATSPGIFGKLKNMITGQKPTQGTATKNATTGEEQPEMQGYIQSPTANPSGDILDKAKERLGQKGTQDVGSEQAWPSPTKPDMGDVAGATRTDADGQPIEGPTQPTSEDTKKEGLMTKLMDKLHLS